MEGLIFLFAGIIQILFAAVFGAISLCLWLVGSLVETFAFTGVTGFRKTVEKSQPGPLVKRGVPRCLKLAGRWSGVLGLLIFIMVGAINFFCFEAIVGKVLTTQMAKRGIEFQYEKLEGNLFTGRISIAGIKVKSERYAITAENLDANVAMSSLLSRTITIQKLHLDGMQGHAKMADQESTGTKVSDDKKKRWFTIRDLSVSRVAMDLTYDDGGKPPINSLRIDTLKAETFQSRWAVYYLFFRSNLKGELNGQPLFVSVEDRKPRGRRTLWRVESLPLAPLGTKESRFLHFESGEVALEVTDEWLLDERLKIDMDWRLSFSNVKAAAPDGSLVRRAVASYLNSKTGPIKIQFGLKLDPDRFEGSSSMAANELYRGVMDAMAEAIAERAPISKEKVKETQHKSIDFIKGVIDRSRK